MSAPILAVFSAFWLAIAVLTMAASPQHGHSAKLEPSTRPVEHRL